jgi:hypothetical protein
MAEENKDLTVSQVDRQNILNNPYALEEIEKATNIKGIPFEGKSVVLKEQVAQFFGVSTRTIETYLADFEAELTENGYEVLTGKRLKLLKSGVSEMDVAEENFGNIKNAPKLGIFDFRAFLNIAMLVSEGEQAKLLRQTILDIVIDTINLRTGGGTKYINQRDEDFLHSWFVEEDYRQQFTDALRDYVSMGNFKYPHYTNKVYNAIFHENAKEYRAILSLDKKDKVRDTFYSEVLDLVSSFEYGFAEILTKEAKEMGRPLSSWEADALFADFENQGLWKPLIEIARNKMASRDLAFRDALHQRLKEYVTPLKREEFDTFLGEKSMELAERLEDAKDVMKRLKERE